MCYFKSAILTKRNVFNVEKTLREGYEVIQKGTHVLIHSYLTDSHDDMIEAAGLSDDLTTPEFVRLEIVPVDDDIFNHDMENWKCRVDQDLLPKWFNLNAAVESLMREALTQTFDKCFLTKGIIDRIDSGRWYISGSVQVNTISGSAQVNTISGSAQVRYIWDSAQVRYICGSAQVKFISGSAQVNTISGSAQVNTIEGSAQVRYICGSAQVKFICGSAQVNIYSENAVVREIKDNAIVIIRHTPNPIIRVANKHIKVEVV